MTGNLVISSFVAVSIHVLILSLPVPSAVTTVPSSGREPILLSFARPEVGGTAAAEAIEAGATAALETPGPAPKLSSKNIELPLEKKKASKEQVTFRKAQIAAVNGSDVFEQHRSAEHEEPGAHREAGETNPAHGKEASPKETAALRHGAPGTDTIVYARPKYKKNPLPRYPRAARRKGYKGRALLRVQVLESGRVGRVTIADSSGYEMLDQAALKSVRKWTFVPGTRNGRTIDQWVIVPVRFSLR